MKKLTKIAIATVLVMMCMCVTVGIFLKDDETDIAPPEPTAIVQQETFMIEATSTGIPPTMTQIHTATAIAADPTEVPPTMTPIPTATPRPIAPPYREIAEQVETMTEAQWKAYLPILAGNSVINWTGWVEEVNVKFGGGYELWVDMDPPSDLFSTFDVSFDIPDDIALDFEIDQMVVFSGTIDRVLELMGFITVYLDDVSFDN